MLDSIEAENQYYDCAHSSLPDNQTKALMSGDLFGVFDRRGDFRTMGSNEQGLFYREMRHLSRFFLRLEEGALLLLSSSVRLDNAVLAVDLTNAERFLSGEKDPHPRTLHFYRTNFLWGSTCFQRLEVRNYAVEAIEVEMILEFEADFADIFEVRGHRRERRGQLLEPDVGKSHVALGYRGLDGLRRETRVELDRTSAVITANQMRIPIRLAPGEQTNISIRIQCSSGEEAVDFPSESEAADQLATRGAEIAKVEIYTSNEQFNGWMNRSVADLRMLLAATPEGIYPYAGVPWFSTTFGRDGIVTALECLWACPKSLKEFCRTWLRLKRRK
jgi:glycogen debranching enzyme